MDTNLETYQGTVRDREFIVTEPTKLRGQSYQLTTISRQAAELPAQRLINLQPYEGQTVTVQGYLNGGYIYEARIFYRVQPEPLSKAEVDDLLEQLPGQEQGREEDVATYYDAEEDQRNRDNYYAHLTRGSATEFYEALSSLLESTHQTHVSYRPAKELYPLVDLHPDQKVHSIYSDKDFDPSELIMADLEADQQRQAAMAAFDASEMDEAELQAALDQVEATHLYNCEHSVPQSWFHKNMPMVGDLHHLFACEPNCNSFRGNTPYFDFEGMDGSRKECGRREPGKFEPTARRGTVARATLYFVLRYPHIIQSSAQEYDAQRIQGTLLKWHQAEPPGEYEKHRNAAISARQGNRNPLIDHPEWANQIDFTRGIE